MLMGQCEFINQFIKNNKNIYSVMTQLLMMPFSLVIQLVYNSLKLEELVGLSFTPIWPGRNIDHVMRRGELCLEWKLFLLGTGGIIR